MRYAVSPDEHLDLIAVDEVGEVLECHAARGLY